MEINYIENIHNYHEDDEDEEEHDDLILINTHEIGGHIIINEQAEDYGEDDNLTCDDNLTYEGDMTYNTLGDLTHDVVSKQNNKQPCQVHGSYRNVMYVVDNVIDSFENTVGDHQWYQYLTKSIENVGTNKDNTDETIEFEEEDETLGSTIQDTIQDTLTFDDPFMALEEEHDGDKHDVKEVTFKPKVRAAVLPAPNDEMDDAEEERTLNTTETLITSPYDEHQDRKMKLLMMMNDGQAVDPFYLTKMRTMDGYIQKKFNDPLAPPPPPTIEEEEEEEEDATVCGEEVEIAPDGSVLVGNEPEIGGLQFERPSLPVALVSRPRIFKCDSSNSNDIDEKDEGSLVRKRSNTSNISISTAEPDEEPTTTNIIQRDNETVDRSNKIIHPESGSGLEMRFSAGFNMLSNAVESITSHYSKNSKTDPTVKKRPTTPIDKDSITVHTAETTKDGEQSPPQLQKKKKKNTVTVTTTAPCIDATEQPKVFLRNLSPSTLQQSQQQQEAEEEAAARGGVEVICEDVKRSTTVSQAVKNLISLKGTQQTKNKKAARKNNINEGSKATEKQQESTPRDGKRSTKKRSTKKLNPKLPSISILPNSSRRRNKESALPKQTKVIVTRARDDDNHNNVTMKHNFHRQQRYTKSSSTHQVAVC
jgi:hypothetical protein